MDNHRIVLGALFLALGLMGLVGMVAVCLIFMVGGTVLSTVAAQEPDFPRFLAVLPMGFGIFICTAIAIGAVPAVVAGYGLLARRNWARVWSLVAGVLNLPTLPLGTGIGVYAIWFFLQDQTGAGRSEPTGGQGHN